MPETDINEEMRLIADFAVNSAKQRYGWLLDYSEESLEVLDDVLEKIYWGFYSHNRDEGEGGLVFNTAIIWGGYLGEYMRFKWGGTWILKGTQRLISITGTEFSPINFVFQRITSHPEYRIKQFIQDTKKSIYTAVIHTPKSETASIPPLKVHAPASSPQRPQSTAIPPQELHSAVISPQIIQADVVPLTKPPSAKESETPSIKKKPAKPVKRLFNADIRLVYAMGGILGILIIITTFVVVYAFTSPGGFPAFGVSGGATSTSSFTVPPTIFITSTLLPTNTLAPTITELPTYTPKPTRTLTPSVTPSLTFTITPSHTPTETLLPTSTRTRYRSPTPTQGSPSDTPRPPVWTPTSTTPPPQLLSCTVNPSTIPPGEDTPLTFAVHFSAPGYNMTVTKFDPVVNGQTPCSATAGGDGTALCTGSSGAVPAGTTITVTITTPLRDCTVSYSS